MLLLKLLFWYLVIGFVSATLWERYSPKRLDCDVGLFLWVWPVMYLGVIAPALARWVARRLP